MAEIFQYNNSFSISKDLSVTNDTGNRFPQTFYFQPAPALLTTVVRVTSKYYVPSMIGVGLLGNAVVTLGLLFKTKKGVECALFMGAKAVTDALYLLAYTFLWLAEYGFNMYHSPGWCQFLTFINGATVFLSMWYSVCISVERFITLLFPVQRHKICSLMKVKVTVIGMTVLAIPIYLNMSLTTAVEPTLALPRCTRLTQFIQAMQVLGKIDAFINVVFPSLLILVLSVLNIIRLCMICRRKHVTNITDTTILDRTVVKERQEISTTVVAAVVCLSHFVLCLPSNCFRIYQLVKIMTGARLMVSHADSLVQNLLMYIFNSSFMIHILIYPCWQHFRNNLIQFARMVKSHFIRRCFRKPTAGNIEEDLTAGE